MAFSRSSPQEFPSFRAMRLVEICEATLANCMECILVFLRDNAPRQIGMNLLKAYHAAEDYDSAKSQLSSSYLPVLPVLQQYLKPMGAGDPEGWHAVTNCLLLSISSSSHIVADARLVNLFQQILIEYSPSCPPVITAASSPDRSGLRYVVVTETHYQQLIGLLVRLEGATIPGMEDWWHCQTSASD